MPLTDVLQHERAAGITRADYSACFSPAQLAQIKALPRFVKNGMATMDFAAIIEFYSKRYLRQLPDYSTVSAGQTIVDVGAGAGWLSLTLALETSAKIIALEPDPEARDTAQALFSIMGVADRITLRADSLSEGIALPDHAADWVFCIEVLEHVQRSAACVQELARIVGGFLIATTPNRWFPVIAHDTRLPFAHWLPISVRRSYAQWAGKNPDIEHNLFFGGTEIDSLMPQLQRISGFLHYQNLSRFWQTFPFYVPYDRGYWEHLPSKSKRMYYQTLSLMGAQGYRFMPNLAGVFRRI